jgi:ferredoxin like protein
VRLEEKLYLLRHVLDEKSHIKIDEEACMRCTDRVCLDICPANVYSYVESKVFIAYENCVECGTCRIACPFVEWVNPKGGTGISYRYG